MLSSLLPFRDCFHLGLTGGIGSGKSTVACMLAQRGAVVVDADTISRAATSAGGAAMPQVRQIFGEAMVDAAGALDRQAMRRLVFSDATARRRLEAIVHPIVMQECVRQAQAACAEGAACVVFDVPLLAESHARWRPMLDAVWVVDCDEQTQIERVMARNQWSRHQVEAVLASQATRGQRLAVADAVIANGADVSLDVLASQVGRLWVDLPVPKVSDIHGEY